MDYHILLYSVIALMAIYYGKRSGVGLVSSYNVFIIFCSIYVTGLYLALIFDVTELTLFSRVDLFTKLIDTSTFGLLFFSLAYFGKRRGKKWIQTDYKSQYKLSSQYYILYIILSIPLIYFGKQYGWHAYSREGISNLQTTLFAYIKYFYIVMGIVAFASEIKFKHWRFLVLASQMMLMIVDGGRTTFFGFLIAIAFIEYRRGWRIHGTRIILIAVFLVAVIGARVIAIEQGIIDGIRVVFSTEARFGGYTALQAVSVSIDGHKPLLFGLSYVLDPIIYLLPREIRDNFLFFNNWVGGNNLSEQFAPMGGFFYIAEAYGNFGIWGGILVGCFYGYILRLAENCSIEKLAYSAVFIATIGSLLAKIYFANALKIYLFSLMSFTFISIFLLTRVNKEKDTFLLLFRPTKKLRKIAG